MKPRGPWQGMITIARLNWPFYAAAFLVLIGASFFLVNTTMPVLRLASGVAIGAAVYFLIGSLGVSHLIYDRSDLYRWHWLQRSLHGAERKQMIVAHSGFDETSAALKEQFPDTHWIVLDHFDEPRMTEPSIRRARRLFPPTPHTVPTPPQQWPVAADSTDVVFGILAIHELRCESERSAWFAEARRCLRPGGRVVLVEHVRDTANFLAFGPGFLHFHSVASWRRCWTSAGLRALDQFRLTPWLCVFVLGSDQ